MKIKVSFPRRRESRPVPVKNREPNSWIPAFAGMTKKGTFYFLSNYKINNPPSPPFRKGGMGGFEWMVID
jgi:hypothetical protein